MKNTNLEKDLFGNQLTPSDPVSSTTSPVAKKRFRPPPLPSYFPVDAASPPVNLLSTTRRYSVVKQSPCLTYIYHDDDDSF